ncbi:hypothetical protein HYS54_00745 [Candidatus Micrarchaeota archaeon]|nr:hypothetical protein [Candidatus Micrarchaeota archaeon]
MAEDPTPTVKAGLVSHSLVKLLDHYLTVKQKLVVSALHCFDGKGRTFTSLVSLTSERCGVSEPTTRRTLQLMRRTGIIEKRGRYVKLSGIGEEVSRALCGDSNDSPRSRQGGASPQIAERGGQVQPGMHENFK